MGQKRRGAFLRLSRILEHLYPGISCRPLFGRPVAVLSVAYVLTIIASGWWLVVPRTLLLDWSSHKVRVTCIVIVFSWCAFVCTASYLLTALTDPGDVPDSWRPVYSDTLCEAGPSLTTAGQDTSELTSSGYSLVPRTDAADLQLVEARSSSVVLRSNPRQLVPPQVVLAAGAIGPSGNLRYCRVCRVYKPARTHHCSICRRCTCLLYVITVFFIFVGSLFWDANLCCSYESYRSMFVLY